MQKILLPFLISLFFAAGLSAQIDQQEIKTQIENLEADMTALFAEMTKLLDDSRILKDTFNIPGVGTINMQQTFHKTFPEGFQFDKLFGMINKELDQISKEDWDNIGTLLEQFGIEELSPKPAEEQPDSLPKTPKKKTYRL